MFIVTKKQVRPNTGVEFFAIRNFPDPLGEFKQYMYTTYMSTGKLIDSTETISEDGLTKTVVTTWVDQAASEQWNNDPVCNEKFTNLYKQHCADNGINAFTESSQTI
jgi:hypothetical protein